MIGACYIIHRAILRQGLNCSMVVSRGFKMNTLGKRLLLYSVRVVEDKFWVKCQQEKEYFDNCGPSPLNIWTNVVQMMLDNHVS